MHTHETVSADGEELMLSTDSQLWHTKYARSAYDMGISLLSMRQNSNSWTDWLMEQNLTDSAYREELIDTNVVGAHPMDNQLWPSQ